ncbi:hypothetical protein PI124_g1086 [Phytophthora idaei]|nr:hypothetical protein PI125_g1364 [Phytophthora idaei]KAG3170688.1 hypothetical protein PI126_g2252 [Phytophthora idaei]KAG3254349.1 hypothetical protein PI124_g1086 [Phytophthora idaei]
MMPLVSPPRTASTPSYRATDTFPSSRNLYQAIPDLTALHPDSQHRQHFEEELAPLPPYRPRRRVTVLRQPRGCNLVRPCTLASQITRMVLFNGCSAVLSVIAALIVWTMAALAIVTMPLCGCGVSVFNGLLHTVFYLCCTDASIYNALAASAADCIDMDLAEWGVGASGRELHPLLPIRVPPPIGGTREQMFEPCPRFERSLGTSSPRSVLATAYFGCFKLIIGAGQAIAVTLVLGVFAFLIGDKRVPIHLETLTAQHPFAVYTTAFGFFLMALAMLHGVTRVSKVVTRFFCCEAVGG